MLRGRLPRRLTITPQERNRLVRFGAKLGGALDHLVSIVHPNTLRRWIRGDRRGRRKAPVARGRRRTPEQIRRLIIKLARETGWGHTRILGELKKLGVRSVSRNTVKSILKAHGLDPGPRRGLGTWDEFLKIHAATLWQCDFFSKRVLTPKGFRELFIVVFLHAGTRRVFLTPATQHPKEAWVTDQAEAFVRHARAKKLSVEMVMHDRDTKVTAGFDACLDRSIARPIQQPLSNGSCRASSKNASTTSWCSASATWIIYARSSSNTTMPSALIRAWTTSCRSQAA
jgi:putative transposase